MCMDTTTTKEARYRTCAYTTIHFYSVVTFYIHKHIDISHILNVIKKLVAIALIFRTIRLIAVFVFRFAMSKTPFFVGEIVATQFRRHNKRHLLQKVKKDRITWLFV